MRFELTFNILILDSDQDSCLSCRAFLYQDQIDQEVLQLPDQRNRLDKKLQAAKSIKFFISCISGTTSNGHGDNAVNPCTAYFICYDKKVDEEEVFSLFHDNSFDPVVRKIGKNNGTQNKEDILKELGTVLKVTIF